jgi:hypothetical protein
MLFILTKFINNLIGGLNAKFTGFAQIKASGLGILHIDFQESPVIPGLTKTRMLINAPGIFFNGFFQILGQAVHKGPVKTGKHKISIQIDGMVIIFKCGLVISVQGSIIFHGVYILASDGCNDPGDGQVKITTIKCGQVII